MTINELAVMVEIAQQLGHGSSPVCLNDSRDGRKSYPEASAAFVDSDNTADTLPQKILVFGYA